jgi:RNA-directed DNA polymerase
MGLELKPSKTRLAHTFDRYEQEEPGFDFLGFNIRQFPVGKYQSGKNSNGNLLGFKTLIKPSKKKVKLHSEKLGKIIESHKSAPQQALISRLSSVIRGWANYYSTVVSKDVYKKLDHLIYQQLRAWATYRHPNKDPHWITNKYWLIDQGLGWVFASRKTGNNIPMRLHMHSETPIVRHVKVQGNRSPFDGDWVYWSTRMGKHPEADKRVATLLRKQKGKCSHCGLYFKDGDLLEIDHKIPKSQGGKDTHNNCQLLHRHCHDNKTAQDIAVGTKELDGDWLDANPF